MAINEQDRHRMYGRLEEVLGADEAATLMESLPPDRWDQLATKADLAADIHALEERMGLRLEAMEHRLTAVFRGELNAAITAQTRSMILALVGVTATTAAVAFAAAGLA